MRSWIPDNRLTKRESLWFVHRSMREAKLQLKLSDSYNGEGSLDLALICLGRALMSLQTAQNYFDDQEENQTGVSS